MLQVNEKGIVLSGKVCEFSTALHKETHTVQMHVFISVTCLVIVFVA